MSQVGGGFGFFFVSSLLESEALVWIPRGVGLPRPELSLLLVLPCSVGISLIPLVFLPSQKPTFQIPI